jgi:hypothetical protein
VVIWYIFTRVGTLYQEKSGNPDWDWIFSLDVLWLDSIGSNALGA